MNTWVILLLCSASASVGIIQEFGKEFENQKFYEQLNDDSVECLESYGLDDENLLKEYGDGFLKKLTEEEKACRFVCYGFVHFDLLMNGGPNKTLNLQMIDKSTSIEERSRLLLADAHCRKQNYQDLCGYMHCLVAKTVGRVLEPDDIESNKSSIS